MVTKKFSPITLDSLELHSVNTKKKEAGILNAQLRQTVTTVYPTMNIKNGGLFAPDQYDVAGQEFESVRVTWIDVPAGMTEKQVNAELAKNPNARIVSILSHKLEDVLSEQQRVAIAQELQTREFFENKLRVRGKDGEELEGAPQYRNYEFSITAKEDVDLRSQPVAQKSEPVLNENKQQMF